MKDFFKVIIIIAAVMFSMAIYSQEKGEEVKSDADQLNSAKIEGKNQDKEKVKPEKIYAKKGIVEIQGSIGFSYMGFPAFNGNTINFQFDPAIHYFLVDNFHIGIKPSVGVYHSEYNYSEYSYRSTSVYLSPGLIIGYTFTISPNSLYFDISGYFNYNLNLYITSNQYNNDYAAGGSLKLKYIIHNSSINTGIYYNYVFNEFYPAYHIVGISLGFSVFF